MTIRILSDFDGVWTDHAAEAEKVKHFMAEELARLTGRERDAVDADVVRYGELVLEAPASYGWAPDGRITAYVDEDPFCEANSIAVYIETATEDPSTAPYRDAVLAEDFLNLTSFGDHCFLAGTARFRSEEPPALVPHAAEALETIHDAGAEMVVVSNSSAEKIVGWFQHAGIDASADEGHLVRVRGRAGKQNIGDDTTIEVGGRRIFVDRPSYRAVIERENPDVIVGDVFSLDLALPHVMRTEGHPSAPSMLAMRRCAHTPSWVLDDRAGGAIDVVVDQVDELATLMERLRA